MIEGVEPFPLGAKVRWKPETRLPGIRGVITDSGPIWSFVKIAGSGVEEYTRTALLELVDNNHSDR